MPRKAKRAIFLGVAVGILGFVLSLIPFVLMLEENAELQWYFARRGTVAAPSQVVVIGIDEETAPALGVSDELDEWPRSLHANLVDRLATAGAAVITFDLSFTKERSSKDNQAFADAIGRAGNVVLLERLDPDALPIENNIDGALPEQEGGEDKKPQRFPIEVLRQPALATAPFPLPVVPVRVNRYWSFSPTRDNSPTLPVVALQAFALPYYTDFLTLLEDVRPDAASHLPSDPAVLDRPNSLSDLILEIRQLFIADKQIATDMRYALDRKPELSDDEQKRSALLALISMYQVIDSPYLNFYGPPRSINTLPYQHALQIPFDEISNLNLQGKVVFVGYSGQTLSGQQDSHYSVLSQDSGVHLSGVEIAATAFSNLLKMSSLKPLEWSLRLRLIFLWGLILTMAFCFLSIKLGIALAVVSSIVYLAIASHQFATTAIWIPLMVPIAIQMPIGLFGVICLKLAAKTEELAAKTEENEQNLESVIAGLSPNTRRQLDQNAANLKVKTTYEGICLYTDIQGSTSQTEKGDRDGRLPEIQGLRFEHRKILVRAAAECGGLVRDYIGDATVAYWLRLEQRSDACRAMLTMRDEVERLNQSIPPPGFPTRFGMHCGKIRIGEIIGIKGFGADLIGEPANIAQRIENTNKPLKSQLLVSESMLEGHEGEFITRFLGTFLFEGKDEPLRLHELIGVRASAAEDYDLTLHERFGEALTEFRSQNWDGARCMFEKLRDQFRHDGPTRFYFLITAYFTDNQCGDKERKERIDEKWDGQAVRLPLNLPKSFKERMTISEIIESSSLKTS